jgi:hypothetical protein
MRRVFPIAAALAILTLAGPALTAPTPAPQAAGGKVIKDPAEYNTYMLALQANGAHLQASAFEAFLGAYPASILKIEALEHLMAAYQAEGDQANLEGAAKRLIEAEPNNVRGLVILAYLSRGRAMAGDAEQARLAAAAADYARKGLGLLPGWKSPEGMAAADFAKLRVQAGVIFNGALGFDSLVRHDWAKAQGFYRLALKDDPSDLQNTSQLAIAELEATPLDPQGFWWAAKAQAIATAAGNDAAMKSVGAYARAKYVRYHGGLDGWEVIMTQAQTESAPPAGFMVARAPSPADLAVQAVRDNDPATLSFSDWEFVLAQRDVSPANHAAADKVWSVIQAKQKNGSVRLKLQVLVIGQGADGFDAAVTDEAIKARVADMHVGLAKGAPAPAVGATVTVTGVLSGYRPKPFLFSFDKAVVGP